VADQNRIKQVISNLVDNSIKFTGQGTITVIVEIDNNSNSNNKHRQILASVKDTGMGIAADILPKLFSKFVTNSNKALDLDCTSVRE
jgi:two-component system, OmpR family, sensor histidine kinase VicK